MFYLSGKAGGTGDGTAATERALRRRPGQGGLALAEYAKLTVDPLQRALYQQIIAQMQLPVQPRPLTFYEYLQQQQAQNPFLRRWP